MNKFDGIVVVMLVVAFVVTLCVSPVAAGAVLVALVRYRKAAE